MDFRHPDGMKVPVFLSRRSLLIMTGESRYLWSHGSVLSVNATNSVATIKYLMVFFSNALLK